MTATQIGNTVPTEPSQAELILSQIDKLPTLPAVAVRLLELTADERSSMREVIRLIESDQSLTARVLSLVRRADAGTAVKTVDRAVVALGVDAVRSLVLSLQVFETFSHRKENQGSRFDRVEFWKHSLAVGCAAKLLAEEAAASGKGKSAPVPLPEEAFICGLLHDLGKLVLDACFPKSYDRVVARVEERAANISDVERELFGLDHALAGNRLAAHWRLPAMVVESIWLHHSAPDLTPSRLAHPGHVRFVQVADRVARHMRIGYSGNYNLDEPMPALAAAIGVSADALERVFSALPETVEARANFLGLERLTSKQVYEGALARANAELARANDTLAETNRRLEHRSRCFDAITLLRSAVGVDTTLERIVQSAATAVAAYMSAGRAGIIAHSPARGVFALAASAEAAESCAQDMVPTREIPDPGFVMDSAPGWLPASLLPGELVDRATAVLEAPPAWCYPIRNQYGFAAALLVAGARPSDQDEMLPALADWIGTWLGSAESAVAARRLNEELAEMSQRLMASQVELTRTRSVTMVGEMAAGAAHELNNPLAVISGRAQLLNREGASDEVRKGAALISDHAHRASAIVNELMDFAKPAPPDPTVWDVAGLLGELRRAWVEKKTLAERQFTIHLSANIPSVRADVVQIRTILDELVRNAVEAMRETPEPRLVVNCSADVADDRIVIRIQDNGCGMSPDVAERAFMPFFSHRSAGRGRGLGLSKAARYAEINGGKLRLTSSPSEGTQVFLELPTAPQ